MNTTDVIQEKAKQTPSGPREPALPGKPVVDPAYWTADELAARDDWIHELSGDELSDLKVMASGVRRRIGYDPNGLLETERDDFDLGAFAATLERAKGILRDGLGLFLVRGFPVEAWDRLDCAIVYWGIGRHFGRARSNNPQGDMFGHIADLGKDYGNPKHRGYQSNDTMDYHVDPCDVLTLLCLQTAKSGGQSKIVSSPAVHNEIVRRRPDLAAQLAKPFYKSRHGEEAPGEKPWSKAPLFQYADGYLSVSANQMYVEQGHALPGTPDLTEKQKEALGILADVSEELHFETYMRPGDLPMFNSRANMHTRTAFEDWPEPERRRHLWRLWLYAPYMRPRKPYFENWEKGVWVPGGAKKIVLNAWPDDPRAAVRAS